MHEPETFTAEQPTPCPDCGEPGTVFYDHCLVGWLCRGCYERIQKACEGLAKYAVKPRMGEA